MVQYDIKLGNDFISLMNKTWNEYFTLNDRSVEKREASNL